MTILLRAVRTTPLLHQPALDRQFRVQDGATRRADDGIVTENRVLDVVDRAGTHAADGHPHAALVHAVEAVLRPVRLRVVEVLHRLLRAARQSLHCFVRREALNRLLSSLHDVLLRTSGRVFQFNRHADHVPV